MLDSSSGKWIDKKKPMKSGPISFLSDDIQLCLLIRVWNPKMRSHAHEGCLQVSLRNNSLFNIFLRSQIFIDSVEQLIHTNLVTAPVRDSWS